MCMYVYIYVGVNPDSSRPAPQMGVPRIYMAANADVYIPIYICRYIYIYIYIYICIYI